ncbi:hypothetical protein MMYC01_208777 [Madurella mycetomatis]|uniref:Uncharacterized protein n=1 Tax=Madurella mycetomatis TaxID=100816 RepID=A0A175VVN5_9PEZI|nr:hypothetical protein MMYC01_208777 [Madurella mycetomatis]
MDLLRLLLLSVVVGQVAPSPVAQPEGAQGGFPGLEAADRISPDHGEHATSTPTATARSRVQPVPVSPETPLTAAPGGPMKPIVERREALNLADTVNFNAPSHGFSPHETIIIYPLPTRPGCTTTLYETYGYPCHWDGTETVYPSTTIQTRQVNCNGCENLLVQKDYYFCPNQRINATARVPTPSTYYSTICRPTGALGQQQIARRSPATTTANSVHTMTTSTRPAPSTTTALHPELRARGGAVNANHAAAAAAAAPACATTLIVQPEKSAGKTQTSYADYTTTTISLDCHDCSELVISTALAGYGPPGVFTTTTTVPVGTVTSYACRG